MISSGGDSRARPDPERTERRMNKCPCNEKRRVKKGVRGEITAQGGSRSGGGGRVVLSTWLFQFLLKAIFLPNGLLKRSSIRQVNTGKLFNATLDRSQSHLVLSHILPTPDSFSLS